MARTNEIELLKSDIAHLKEELQEWKQHAFNRAEERDLYVEQFRKARRLLQDIFRNRTVSDEAISEILDSTL